MIHKEYLFDEKYHVGLYIQIPVHNEDLDNIIEHWYEFLMKFEYINEDEQVLSLNDPRNWKTFFEARHSMPANALQKARENETASIITDTIVPPSSFNEFIKKTHQLIQNEKIDYLLFGHLGDCHLHFHLIPNQENEHIAIDCYHKIIRLSSDLGGVYSAEHGTGKRKRQDFIDCYGQDAATQIISCKQGFDPNFLLNTGNVINQ
jgi:D-lactate dehydrogenase (cytochrome)